MTGEDLFQTIAWQANRLRNAEEMILQLTTQAQGLATRASALEVENVALRERLESSKPPEGLD